MKYARLVGLVAAGVFGLCSISGAQESTHEVGFYVGELYGDDLLDVELSGRTPQLEDDMTVGIQYSYSWSDTWGLVFAMAQSGSAVSDLGADIDMDVTLFDASAVWNFLGNGKWQPFVDFGLGYAVADLDRPLTGTVRGQNVTIEDDNGYTYNMGAGAKWFVGDSVVLTLHARYRYFDGLVDNFNNSLQTWEPQLVVGWRF